MNCPRSSGQFCRVPSGVRAWKASWEGLFRAVNGIFLYEAQPAPQHSPRCYLHHPSSSSLPPIRGSRHEDLPLTHHHFLSHIILAPCMQDTSQRTSSSLARLGVPSHIPADQHSPISSHLEEGTDRSVITLQGPQLLPGGFLQLGIEAPGGAALHGEEERNLLEKKGAGLGGKEPHSTDGAASSLAA